MARPAYARFGVASMKELTFRWCRKRPRENIGTYEKLFQNFVLGFGGGDLRDGVRGGQAGVVQEDPQELSDERQQGM